MASDVDSDLASWDLNYIKCAAPSVDADKAPLPMYPWKSDAHFFKKVYISGTAVAKMARHAKNGGSIEVMGLMQGKIVDNCFVITDAFSLPVEGTETRVNAADEANEYLVAYLDLCRQNKMQDHPIGWYHSHPGYGCWLSGIDVSTQRLQQSFQDPFLAVVIDPERTSSSGRLDIGAFRTLPENKVLQGNTSTELGQSIPVAKAQDFGAHAGHYYSLDIESFISPNDDRLLNLLQTKYWVKTLGQNVLEDDRDSVSNQILDISAKFSATFDGQLSPRPFFDRTRGSDFAASETARKTARHALDLASKQQDALHYQAQKLSMFGSLAL